ncbi:MAG: LPXTG cell wall anchor domain-containing protein [Ignavibacteriaceae bacterium]|jgi:LPXTG-motif cell wall-anchored protein|nr:LPXTG cell wall anchor domain-containing protein [Ignavibacteriaceae bacterium]
MKNIFILFATVVLFGGMLSGCLNYTQKTVLNRDGSGTMKLGYAFPAGSQTGRTIAQEFDTAKIRKEIFDTLFTIDKIETKIDSGDALTININISFKNIRDLHNTKLFNMFDISLEDGAPGQMKYQQYIRPSGEKPDPRVLFFRKFIFEFDGEMITHNAHRQEGDEYIWEFRYDEIGDGKYIEATFAPQPPNYLPIYIAVGAVLVAVGGFILIKKRKKKSVAS